MPRQYDEDKQIAHGTLRGGIPYKIYYEGGSLFHMIWEQDGKPKLTSIPKDKLDIMIAQGKIRLLSAAQYKQIESQILPDGSTKTHRADGTLKSAYERANEMLENEHIMVTNPDGSKAIAPDPEPKAPKMPETKVPGPEDVAELEDGIEEAGSEQREDEGTGAQAEEKPQEEAPTQKPVKTRRENKVSGDLNGDGIVDEFDDLVKEEQKKNALVMIIFFAGIVASIFLFFFFHTVTASIFHGEEIDLIPDVIQVEQQPSQQQGNQPEQGGEQGAKDGQGNEGGSQLETVNRSDFDPEDAIAAFPMADAEHEKLAVWLFQQIRTNIYNADRASFEANIDLARIAGELAPAYAEAAAGIQGLTDAERAELEAYWREILVKQEIQHVLDKDPYASMFGGRIREVRQDPNNPLCLYVVTESIAGDHHRICFAINGDSANNWTVTDVLDPKGYVKMVQEGEQTSS